MNLQIVTVLTGNADAASGEPAAAGPSLEWLAADWSQAALLGGGFCIAAMVVFFVMSMTQTPRRSPFMIGDNLDAERAEVVSWSEGRGTVRIGGELWQAQSTEALAAGDAVRVARRQGFLIDVRKARN